MQNLIELHNWNHTRPLPVVHFRPLLRIERLAYENLQHSPRDESDQLADLKLSGKAGVIDLLAHDTRTDEVVLVMNEPRAWDGSDERLHELQERFNAYVSFLLDGELAESNPELAEKHARIEVRCDHIPDARALELLGMIHDQLAFQEIKMEVVVKGRGD